MQQNFIFGGNTGRSYEDLQSQRALAQKLLMRNASAPRNVGEGLNAIGQALLARSISKKADKAEAEQRGEFADQWAAALGGFDSYGGTGETVGTFSPQTDAESVARDPMNSQYIADDTMAALGKEPTWLKYSNQDATRNQPISPDLKNALSFLPEMGVTMEVFSGGQPGKGSGKPRVGSTRHDHGNAADVFFYKDGRRLTWENPDDIPILQDIVRRGKAAGVTGFGAGDGYMQPGSMHVGFGNEAVWGAGGKGANAPEWLKSAFTGGNYEVAQAGGQPPQQPGQNANMRQIAQLLQMSQSPYANEGQKAVAQMLLGQYEQRQAAAAKQNDPLYQMQLEAKRMELAKMRNPQSNLKIEELSDGRKYYVDPTGQQAPRLVNPDIGDAPKALDVEGESKLRKEFMGLQPVKEFQKQSQAFGRIVASAKDPSPAGDLAMVFNFMKVLDPGSVVRESEFATAESAAAWLQDSQEAGMTIPLPIASAIRRMASGQRLAPEQRQDFLDRGAGIYRQSEQQFNDLARQYDMIATDYGFETGRTVPDSRYRPRGAVPSREFAPRPQARPGSTQEPGQRQDAAPNDAPQDQPKPTGWNGLGRDDRDSFIKSRMNELMRDKTFVEKYKALPKQKKAEFWQRQWQRYGGM